MKLEIPAQQKITVEGKAISKSLLFLVLRYHPQHMNTHMNKGQTSLRHPFALTLQPHRHAQTSILHPLSSSFSLGH